MLAFRKILRTYQMDEPYYLLEESEQNEALLARIRAKWGAIGKNPSKMRRYWEESEQNEALVKSVVCQLEQFHQKILLRIYLVHTKKIKQLIFNIHIEEDCHKTSQITFCKIFLSMNKNINILAMNKKTICMDSKVENRSEFVWKNVS